MVSPTTTSYSNTSNLTARQTLAQNEGEIRKTSHNNKNEQTTPSGIVDVIEISPAAQALTSAKDAYYGQFFPTHKGFSSTALAAAVSDPGLETFSAGKTFEQVTQDARANLDEKYKQLKASGNAYDYIYTSSEDVNSLFGDLDRRALVAISTNEDGLFTSEEQSYASSLLSAQHGLAVGLYSGPSSLQGNFVDPYLNDHASRFKASVKWLDRASKDEKAVSLDWAYQRAANQYSYESITRFEGGVPENFDTTHPLAKLIKSALETSSNSIERGFTRGVIASAEDLKNQPWFEGFESQLDIALSQVHELYNRAG